MTTRLASTAGAIALACALAAPAGAHAALITFDDPGLITIDPVTFVATYDEAGFSISGDAATFLPLDAALVGFGGFPLSLMAQTGAAFALTALDAAFYDIGFGEAPGELTVTGLLDGATVASAVLPLSAPGAFSFSGDWARLTEVTFLATSAFSLDNIAVTAAVPVPGTLALAGLALVALVGGRRSVIPAAASATGAPGR